MNKDSESSIVVHFIFLLFVIKYVYRCIFNRYEFIMKLAQKPSHGSPPGTAFNLR